MLPSASMCSDYLDYEYQQWIASRRQAILERMQCACQKAGRRLEDIELVAVSKTVSPSAVASAYLAGYTHFAENRVQELAHKVKSLEAFAFSDMRFDMIGNLQTNKINATLQYATCIQSVSSMKLASAINARAQKQNIIMPCLLEVNISQEQTKSGFSVSDLKAHIEELSQLKYIHFEGLMTMAPKNNAYMAHTVFEKADKLADEINQISDLCLHTRSYGMSDDFEIALEHGANLIRLGRVVFDPEYIFA